jgi:succinyl-CoA synthetase alpha subunit
MIDIDATTPVLIQGVTGRMGRLHTHLMRQYGTRVVAGTGRGAGDVDGIPVFATCGAAVAATGAVASVAMVPPLGTLAAIEEAVAAGLRLIVTPAEGLPEHDALRALRLVRQAGVAWIGASTPGMAVPGQAKLGFLPDVALRPGSLGVMSKSGTLSYEICHRLAGRGIGQSVWIGVGGDAVKGTRFADLVPYFAAHAPTRAVLVVGEIGGTEEEELAAALRARRFDKPVFALIAGATAREGLAMGHAGALIHGTAGTLAAKRDALEQAGVRVGASMGEIVAAIEGWSAGGQSA